MESGVFMVWLSKLPMDKLFYDKTCILTGQVISGTL